MFKVICIDDNWSDGRKKNRGSRAPVFSEIVEVLASVEATVDAYGDKIQPGTYYKLSGFDPTAGFLSTHFAPLSDIDELELIEQRDIFHAVV